MLHGVLILALMLTPASAQQKGAATKTGSAPAAKVTGPPQPVTIPKDAVEIQPGVWEAKDAEGKTWHYRKTPFGIRKYEPENPSSKLEEDAKRIKATDLGDKVRFERRTPFGSSTWEKKKSELNEVEKIAWQRAQAKQ